VVLVLAAGACILLDLGSPACKPTVTTFCVDECHPILSHWPCVDQVAEKGVPAIAPADSSMTAHKTFLHVIAMGRCRREAVHYDWVPRVVNDMALQRPGAGRGEFPEATLSPSQQIQSHAHVVGQIICIATTDLVLLLAALSVCVNALIVVAENGFSHSYYAAQKWLARRRLIRIKLTYCFSDVTIVTARTSHASYLLLHCAMIGMRWRLVSFIPWHAKPYCPKRQYISQDGGCRSQRLQTKATFEYSALSRPPPFSQTADKTPKIKITHRYTRRCARQEQGSNLCLRRDMITQT
jgi:hypothetical protein